jgi:hypothetical protein
VLAIQWLCASGDPELLSRTTTPSVRGSALHAADPDAHDLVHSAGLVSVTKIKPPEPPHQWRQRRVIEDRWDDAEGFILHSAWNHGLEL